MKISASFRINTCGIYSTHKRIVNDLVQSMMRVTVRISYESHISFMAQSINPPARYLNTLRPRQNDCLFTDDTFKRIFLNENIRISNKISPKFVPNGLINNIPALVLIMAWHLPGDKPLSEQWWLDHWRIFASLGLNELNPGPPLLTKAYTMFIPIFTKKGYFFNGRREICEIS